MLGGVTPWGWRSKLPIQCIANPQCVFEEVVQETEDTLLAELEAVEGRIEEKQQALNEKQQELNEKQESFDEKQDAFNEKQEAMNAMLGDMKRLGEYIYILEKIKVKEKCVFFFIGARCPESTLETPRCDTDTFVEYNSGFGFETYGTISSKDCFVYKIVSFTKLDILMEIWWKIYCQLFHGPVPTEIKLRAFSLSLGFHSSKDGFL